MCELVENVELHIMVPFVSKIYSRHNLDKGSKMVVSFSTTSDATSIFDKVAKIDSSLKSHQKFKLRMSKHFIQKI